MGCLRLLLALSVVIAHTSPIFGIRLVSGAAAVETFFIISGFYMALVINEKYFAAGQALKSAYKLFIEARAMRLYPLYAFILALTLVMQAALLRPGVGTGALAPSLGLWVQNFHQMRWFSLLLLAGTNLSLIGQDCVVFSGLNAQTGKLFWTPNFWSVPLPGYHFLFVPQAWTLGLEIVFYLLAPFLVRRKAAFLISVAAASFALKHTLAHLAFVTTPGCIVSFRPSFSTLCWAHSATRDTAMCRSGGFFNPGGDTSVCFARLPAFCCFRTSAVRAKRKPITG